MCQWFGRKEKKMAEMTLENMRLLVLKTTTTALDTFLGIRNLCNYIRPPAVIAYYTVKQLKVVKLTKFNLQT